MPFSTHSPWKYCNRDDLLLWVHLAVSTYKKVAYKCADGPVVQRYYALISGHPGGVDPGDIQGNCAGFDDF